MAHGYKGDVLCTGTWAISGKPCRHIPRPGHDTCAAHDPAGDQRKPPLSDEARCQGTNKESGERCRLAHEPGTTVCFRHGGNAPQVRSAGQVRAVEEELTALAANLVGKPVDNPLAELSRVAGRARAWTEMLEQRVRALLDGDTGEHDTACPHCGEELPESFGGNAIRYGHRAGEQIRGEVQLYERAIGTLARILADIGRLKIDERLAAITSRQADAVIAALDAGLAAAGVIDPQQRVLAKAAASRELRLVR